MSAGAGRGARDDEVPLELRDVYGLPPAKAAVALPLLHEPRVKLSGGRRWTTSWRSRRTVPRRYDAPTTLWPAGAVLAHALASDCASWQR